MVGVPNDVSRPKVLNLSERLNEEDKFKAFGLVDRGYGHPGLRPGLLTFKTFGLIAGLRFATIAQHSIQSMPRMT